MGLLRALVTDRLNCALSSTEMLLWLLCRSMQGSPGPQLMNGVVPEYGWAGCLGTAVGRGV